ncbi:IclR family transcriptional regulator [Halorussus salinisoli]|uniref:IclR family transcriptional regulator n=1 Tax=Halorussus salinisoli TaxID=2558242 RepID=UPI0010C18356|nr:IclR family transcriptional regulator [Halorussus salinisoli]
MDIPPEEPSKTIKSVQKAFDIVERLQQLNGASIAELSTELDLPKSTIHSHLTTLRERGYIVKTGDTYYAGLLFLNLGTKARERHSFFSKVKPKMERLAQETNERTQLMIEEHGRGIYVYRAHGSHGVQTASRIGKPRHLHTGAAGKAILASLPEERVERIIDQWGLPPLTPNTLDTSEKLFDELAAIRERGYAINREEHIEGLWAIGAVIENDNQVLGALSISGPTYRIKEQGNEEEIRHKLLGVINEIELDMQSE